MTVRGNPNWAKGRSGNPSGRRKTDPEQKALLQKLSYEALDVVVAIMRDKAHADRFKAATVIMDRAWGKPVQAMEHSGQVGIDVTSLSDEELDARIAALIKSAGT